jgi:hypothetical protein
MMAKDLGPKIAFRVALARGQSSVSSQFDPGGGIAISRGLAGMDDWTRKLQVGVYLRSGALSDYHRMKARVLRDKLDLLEHEVAEGDIDEIRKVTHQISLCYRRMQHAFLEEM